MPPGGGGGGGQDGCTNKDHRLPATGLRRDTPPSPTPPSSASAPVVYQRRKKRQLKGRDEDSSLPCPTPPPAPAAIDLQVDQQHAEVSIPEGPLMEILSRVPYSSLCRFKCVSRSWLALCSDPDVRKRSPQTLSGFFHNHRRENGGLKFRYLSGRGPPMVDPALPFLRDEYERFMFEQCCGGLLLCKCWKKSCAESDDEIDLVVCNPATEEWTVLPPIELPDEEDGDVVVRYKPPVATYLGFDPAISDDCFVVFVPLLGCLDNVAIYSSETGEWIQSGWDEGVPVVTDECVYLNGFIHFMIEDDVIAVVDPEAEGEDWQRITLPDDMEPEYGSSSIGHSRGLLHAWYIDPSEGYQLSVWVLEDYNESDKWTLKHTVDVLDLFDTECDGESCEVFAIHPDRNLVFVTNRKDTTLSYDMDSQDVRVMCTFGEFLGGVPYIPYFGDWLSDEDEGSLSDEDEDSLSDEDEDSLSDEDWSSSDDE